MRPATTAEFDPVRTPGPLPSPRGPLSALVIEALGGSGRPLPLPPADAVRRSDEDDLHLALYCCYELHYDGFASVDDGWEWDPSLLAFRGMLEGRFEEELSRLVGGRSTAAAEDVVSTLWALARAEDGPSLSGWLETHATLDQARELAVCRSAYQLKEADPHTWALPRLRGPAKAAMAAIQADEYGAGDPERVHATLFARTMEALGLDPTPHAYLDAIPGPVLAGTNLISLFGLHRRWRGALVGHLALFEMTSVGPMGRMSRCLERLGVDAAGRAFYDVHVVADEVHQHLAVDGMVAPLLAASPELASDVVFGARALQAVDTRATSQLLGAWAAGVSALRGGSLQ